MRKPEVFKMACLRDIRRLFGAAGNPFYAGFGNRITDALSYRSVDVPSSRIFTIDSTGDVKMELLELAGYKSSYIHMTDLVDQMFPPIHRRWVVEYTDSNFWKAPMAEYSLPDLTPPSPALSARSDTSNQSTLARLRNFSLVPSRGKSSQLLPTAAVKADSRNSHLRQMSSFERLAQTLERNSPFAAADSRRSVSPQSSSTYLDSGSEDEGDLDWHNRQRRPRKRSVSSMPGSLPGSDTEDDGVDERDDNLESGFAYEEEDGEGEGDDEHEDHHNEETFDEDLLAAGEMARVPFL